MAYKLGKVLDTFLNDNENHPVVIARGAGSALFVTVVGVGISFLLHILLVRLAGPVEYGVYMYAYSWLTIMIVPATAGFRFPVTRFLATYEAARDWPLYRALIRYTNRAVLATSLTVALLAAAVVILLRDRLSEGLLLSFLAAWAILPFAALTSLRVAALRSLRSILLANTPQSIIRPLLLALSVSSLAVLTSIPLTGENLMLFDLLVHVAVFLLCSYWLKRKTPAEASEGPVATPDITWRSYALWLALYSGVVQLMHRVDTVMIGYFLGTTPVGTYAIAERTALLVTFSLTAISHIGAPIIASLYNRNRTTELQNVLTFIARLNFAFSLPAFLFMVFAGQFILGLFSTEAVSGYYALLLLAFGHASSALSGAVGYVMHMTGHQTTALKIIAVSALINIVLNVLFIPRWGIEGAAAATAISVIFSNAVSLIFVRTRLGLRTSVF